MLYSLTAGKALSSNKSIAVSWNDLARSGTLTFSPFCSKL
jgi:hypothetical protein